MNKVLEKARAWRSRVGSSSKRPVKKSLRQEIEKKPPLVLFFPIAQQIMFTKRLGMILRSGLPIVEGLSMLKDQANTRSSAHIFDCITVDVTNGQTLSSGMQRFEKYFGSFCVNIIRVAENSGTLHQNLEYLAEELKKKQTLKRKVIGALIYPAIIVCATIGIVVLLTVYIFPKIVPIFMSVGSTLPLTTRMLMAISNYLSHWGFLTLGGVVGLLVAFFFAMRDPRVHLFFDRVLLKIPIFGSLSQYYNLANISRTLGLLLNSDVRIVHAIELVADSTNNLAYRTALLRSRERLIQGQKFSEQFVQESTLFPPMFSQMMGVGETTGNLAKSFRFLNEMYEEEINELTKNMTTMIEPILMIAMGIIVGFIAISIITPIYGITQNLNAH